METKITLPPMVNYLTGIIDSGDLIHKHTKLGSLKGVFADQDAYNIMDPEQVVYSVDVLNAPQDEGELYFGVSHIQAGTVGDEFFMTRGHFHQRIEQGEFYFGIKGRGLLVLQSHDGSVECEHVCPGSIHQIKGHTAHRLVNVGTTELSALAVWPVVAGHDYGTLKEEGFNVRVLNEGGKVRIKEKGNV